MTRYLLDDDQAFIFFVKEPKILNTRKTPLFNNNYGSQNYETFAGDSLDIVYRNFAI